MTNIAILWHMHQPYYEDLATGEHVLPWVRMHALKDYYGMAALLREFPSLRLTFNLVPSLLVQLQAFAEERARDWHLDLGLKPAVELTEEEQTVARAEFFHAPRRMIDQYPRYAELLHLRESGAPFAESDLRDLQVWHKLSWVDPFFLDTDPRVRQLISKQRHFDERDKQILRQIELELIRKVIPEYRSATERGQAELSTSPFYHPILPLLCDTDIYLRNNPSAPVPRPPFRHAEDAREQLVRARECHRQLFGHDPVGLWPSEGSVSDEVAALAAAAGFRWLATDEAILGRSIGREFRRDAQGRVEDPEPLYRPYTLGAGPAQITCLFRDHSLSDLIGFVYAGWSADAAANDFVGRLVEAGRRFSSASGGAEATIPIILDGENAWEHFAGGGRPFLRALYHRLSSNPELKTVTMSTAAAGASRTINSIYPGSWIDSNFFIWIGHQDDLRAWRQLREARAMFALAAPAAPPDDRERAHKELLIAEGSDWFWWYGDDHSSEHDLEFDDLFRRHVRNIYQMLGQAIPDELFATNITTGAVPLSVVTPVGLLHPTLDGRSTSYFEWLAAGVVETDAPSGTMTGGEKRAPLIRNLLFGFDLTHLYFRIDINESARESLQSGLRCTINFTTPPNLRLVLSGSRSGIAAELLVRGESGKWMAVSGSGPEIAAEEVLEASVAFTDLGLTAGRPFAFFVSVLDNGNEVERHPAHRPVESMVPSASFERNNWRA